MAAVAGKRETHTARSVQAAPGDAQTEQITRSSASVSEKDLESLPFRMNDGGGNRYHGDARRYQGQGGCHLAVILAQRPPAASGNH
jgi:hypothetical protein